jgi:hypothetical protein
MSIQVKVFPNSFLIIFTYNSSNAVNLIFSLKLSIFIEKFSESFWCVIKNTLEINCLLL